MGVWDVLTLSHFQPAPLDVISMCWEQIQAEVARQHIVFVCIKICAIKWTIKCPFVIFIGLQCCKMLKAFIFSRAMTKARSSIVHGQNVDQSIFYTHFSFFSPIWMITTQCYDKVIKKEIELCVGWLWLVMTTGRQTTQITNYWPRQE